MSPSRKPTRASTPCVGNFKPIPAPLPTTLANPSCPPITSPWIRPMPNSRHQTIATPFRHFRPWLSHKFITLLGQHLSHEIYSIIHKQTNKAYHASRENYLVRSAILRLRKRQKQEKKSSLNRISHTQFARAKKKIYNPQPRQNARATLRLRVSCASWRINRARSSDVCDIVKTNHAVYSITNTAQYPTAEMNGCVYFFPYTRPIDKSGKWKNRVVDGCRHRKRTTTIISLHYTLHPREPHRRSVNIFQRPRPRTSRHTLLILRKKTPLNFFLFSLYLRL